MKNLASYILKHFKADAFFRMLNKKRLLILCYHGICSSVDCPPNYAQIPVDRFEWQLQFLKKHYNIISMSELIKCQREKRAFPKNAALITFDDGFMNNYEYAFPLLKEYKLPATIFLTVDYIGTKKLLLADEMFLLLMQALKSDVSAIRDTFGVDEFPENIIELYPFISKKVKKLDFEEYKNIMFELRGKINVDFDSMGKNFRLLGWDQVNEMKVSGLIEFGVHTATHRILTKLPINEWEKEIFEPKVKLSKILGCDISSFCYPNGIPDMDFTKEHENYVKNAGYDCAFSTGEWLNICGDNSFRFGRILVGNNITSDRNYFRLTTSGFVRAINNWRNRK